MMSLCAGCTCGWRVQRWCETPLHSKQHKPSQQGTGQRKTCRNFNYCYRKIAYRLFTHHQYAVLNEVKFHSSCVCEFGVCTSCTRTMNDTNAWKLHHINYFFQWLLVHHDMDSVELYSCLLTITIGTQLIFSIFCSTTEACRKNRAPKFS